MSIRDNIRAAQDIESEIIPVPQWKDEAGEPVRLEVRSMSGLARARLLKQASGKDGTMNFEKLYPSILIACCYDPESGERIFDEDDAGWLNDKSAGPVERLAQAGMRLSGLNQSAADDAKKGS